MVYEDDALGREGEGRDDEGRKDRVVGTSQHFHVCTAVENGPG